jgi:hypothetical protein
MINYLVVGALLGYTISPVPARLLDALERSNILKFIVLLLTFYMISIPIKPPETRNDWVEGILSILLILVGLEIWREYDRDVVLKKGTLLTKDAAPLVNPSDI